MPRLIVLALALFVVAVAALRTPAAPRELPAGVREAEAKRVAVIAQVRPAVCAVCFYGGEACGSGVVIDPEGYALTNFHVVEPTGTVMQCGLADGELYDAVVVGLDKVGDVALIKLVPKKPGVPFPFVKLADSELVKVGDWSLAMGNPFGLSLDFTPTVTFGLVSGVHRYQPPEGQGTLEYTDCIQIDTSINPGNSGGPLFNSAGELIGINGRGSFEKRGRVNSGVGYAISVNQIKNFLGHFRAGLDTDHATLGAVVETESEDGDLSRMVVRQILEESDASRRGVQINDQMVNFAGRRVTSVNQYKNVLGIYPKEWRLPLTYQRGNDRKEALVRLMGNMDAVAPKPDAKPPGGGPPKPGGQKPTAKAGQDTSPAKKLFEAKPGFANYYFNRQRQQELRDATAARLDLGGFGGAWALEGAIELADRKGDVRLTWGTAADGLAEVKIQRNAIEDAVKPLKPDAPLGELLLPQGSGGMLTTLYQYRRLLTEWKAGFEIGFDHGGHEPFYVARPDGKAAFDAKAARVDCEVLRTRHGAFETKWFFRLGDRRLVGCESVVTPEEEPCELIFSDFKPVEGRELPHRIEVRTGDKRYGVLTVARYQLGKK